MDCRNKNENGPPNLGTLKLLLVYYKSLLHLQNPNYFNWELFKSWNTLFNSRSQNLGMGWPVLVPNVIPSWANWVLLWRRSHIAMLRGSIDFSESPWRRISQISFAIIIWEGDSSKLAGSRLSHFWLQPKPQPQIHFGILCLGFTYDFSHFHHSMLILNNFGMEEEGAQVSGIHHII